MTAQTQSQKDNAAERQENAHQAGEKVVIVICKHIRFINNFDR